MSKRVMAFVGLLATPAATSVAQLKVPARTMADETADNRLAALKRFFSTQHCPLQSQAADFLTAADRNHLDWRLLPSISIVESGGGKAYRNNNVLGWANSDKKFGSVSDGIHVVARRLAHSRLYRYKSIDRILATYNPRPEYSRKVKQVMRTIAMAGTRPAPAAY